MNYSQEQIDAFVLEARDRERARCIGRLEEMRKYHQKHNPKEENVIFILDRAIDELR